MQLGLKRDGKIYNFNTIKMKTIAKLCNYLGGVAILMRDEAFEFEPTWKFSETVSKICLCSSFIFKTNCTKLFCSPKRCSDFKRGKRPGDSKEKNSRCGIAYFYVKKNKVAVAINNILWEYFSVMDCCWILLLYYEDSSNRVNLISDYNSKVFLKV